MPFTARPRIAAAALLTAFLFASPDIGAKTLYKLVDKSGRVSYVDQVPRNFDGEVTKLDGVPAPASGRERSAPAPSAAPSSLVEEPKESPPDINKQRRETRERLQLALDRARASLAAARKARDEGTEPLDGEYQVIQQRFDASNNKPGPRPNCRKQADGSGREAWICATQVPGESYRDRQKALDDAVVAAEAEVEAAERAYRRGVD